MVGACGCHDLGMGQLEGKVAIVTGGAGGIGGASARALGREGASVVVVDIDDEGAARVAAEIKASGGKAIFVETDVSREAEVASMIASTVNEFGRLDILHNNAALTESDFLSRDTGVTEIIRTSPSRHRSRLLIPLA